MFTLDQLKNTSRPYKARKRVGRGIGSKLGKTCGRGEKGAGSRAGYKRRWGKEGGNMPLFMKLPIRGFNNIRFKKPLDVVNFKQLDAIYSDGETVNLDTLRQKGLINKPSYGVKILAHGDLTKKLNFDVAAVSTPVQIRLETQGIDLRLNRRVRKYR